MLMSTAYVATHADVIDGSPRRQYSASERLQEDLMSMRRRSQQSPQQPRVRKPGTVEVRTRPGSTKAELREQATEAVASYEGPITRCPPKRRRAP
jgi:hypothetical protein